MDMLQFLYDTAPGRALLFPLSSRGLSKLCGRFLDSGLSKPLIKGFIRKAGIDTEEYVMDGFTCFNDCFSRHVKEGRRPIEMDPSCMIAPSDGLLSVWEIKEDTVLPLKQSSYTVKSLLRDSRLAKRYEGGLCLVYRLCVNHYHRYGYVESGRKSGALSSDDQFAQQSVIAALEAEKALLTREAPADGSRRRRNRAPRACFGAGIAAAPGPCAGRRCGSGCRR